MATIDLTPIIINGKMYIEITSDEMLRVITMGVHRVIKSREVTRRKYAEKTGRIEPCVREKPGRKVGSQGLQLVVSTPLSLPTAISPLPLQLQLIQTSPPS